MYRSLLRTLQLSLFSALCFSASGQDQAFQDRFSIGMQLVQYQQDFAFGAQLTSPYFGGPVHMAVRGQFNGAFLDHLVDSTGKAT